MKIPSTVLKKINLWQEPPYDEETHGEIRRLLKENPEELVDAFSSNLTFGTGGVRALMGVGPGRLNSYTIATITQGFASYLKKAFPKEALAVVVGFDSRHFSKTFAEKAACVLAGNGIKVFLFSDIRPTPFISFALRHLKACAAVMITASHNPKEYNGYKAYWQDGGQVVFPHDAGIIKEVEKIGSIQEVLLSGLESPKISMIHDELDGVYLGAIAPLQLFPKDNALLGKNVKIAYTSLHGTGITIVPEALKSWGFTQIFLVKDQVVPDGDFPTTKFPNPEIKETLFLGLQTFEKKNCDLLIATDPDADRLGVVVRHLGKPYILNGNQVAALCLHYLLENKQKRNELSKNLQVVSTIVTTRLLKTLSMHYGTSYEDVLTGFKYIAEKIHLWEISEKNKIFLFGAEESYGSLYGTQSRDKDAIIASCLIAEMVTQAKKENKSLVDKLFEIFKQFGVFLEGQKTISFPEGVQALEQMGSCMERLRKSRLTEVDGLLVEKVEDFKEKKKDFPLADILVYHLVDGTVIIIRPSGTEPKIKIYAGVVEKMVSTPELALKTAEKKLQKILKTFETLLKS